MSNYDYEDVQWQSYIDEIEAYSGSEKVSTFFNQKDKEDLFFIGVIFAAGKEISIWNIIENTIKTGKSFNHMVEYWETHDLKPYIKDECDEKNIFLICPVRNATEEQKKEMMKYIEEKEASGFKIHYPERDTNQVDETGGYRICLDNANAIAKAKSVHIYYDRSSTGTLFDLGITFYLMKKNPEREFVLLNKDSVTLERNDFGDSLILDLIERKI